MMDNQMKKRQSGRRPKKYKFRGNQFSSQSVQKGTCKRKRSASSKKLGSRNLTLPDHNDFEGYIIIDKDLVFQTIQNSVCCKVCNGNIRISTENVGGLSEKLLVSCEYCGDISSSRNSMLLGQRKNIPELNIRFIYAMRALGQGLKGAKTFCGIMDMSPPVSVKPYNTMIKKIKNVSSSTARQSMHLAAEEEIEMNGRSMDLTVSGDGTWKTRGHSSLVGVCTVIGANTGKVLDTEVLSSKCKGCSSWKGTRGGTEYERWKELHAKVCQKNHSGSSGMMEVVGMRRIFERSEVLHKVRYGHYIGDGDCKTFLNIEKAQPYGKDFLISKIECVGHIQKRMGTKLRKKKQELKGKKLNDGKPIGGKGRLSDDLINKITIYYGNAIRKHSDSVRDMQKAIWAIFYHKRASDLEPTHDFCPTGSNSWCLYQKALANNKEQDFKHMKCIPPAVMDAIKDVFKELSMPSLLKKCLGGYTQNCNESLNSMIWKFCPKTSGSGPDIVNIAVNEAVVLFNDGQLGRLKTMGDLGFQIGWNARSFAEDMDDTRIQAAEKDADLATFEARRARKRSKLATEEAQKEKEGEIYSPGMF